MKPWLLSFALMSVHNFTATFDFTVSDLLGIECNTVLAVAPTRTFINWILSLKSHPVMFFEFRSCCPPQICSLRWLALQASVTRGSWRYCYTTASKSHTSSGRPQRSGGVTWSPVSVAAFRMWVNSIKQDNEIPLFISFYQFKPRPMCQIFLLRINVISVSYLGSSINISNLLFYIFSYFNFSLIMS